MAEASSVEIATPTALQAIKKVSLLLYPSGVIQSRCMPRVAFASSGEWGNSWQQQAQP
jgi:hypothetical protein